jgi:hypothetical protein
LVGFELCLLLFLSLFESVVRCFEFIVVPAPLRFLRCGFYASLSLDLMNNYFSLPNSERCGALLFSFRAMTDCILVMKRIVPVRETWLRID